MPNAFEIICLGNELLIGKILNSNAQWLAKNVTSLGGTVQR
ncbi:MAG: molybdopterin-binding protein, partial [Candidatus Bathyarchaeia archaeon]